MAASIGVVLPAFNSSAAEVVLCSVVSCALRWGSAFRSLKCDESGPICQSERVVSWGIDLGGDYAVSAEILRVSAVERAKAISVLVTFAEVAVLNFSIFCYVMPLFLEQPPSICSQKASRQKNHSFAHFMDLLIEISWVQFILRPHSKLQGLSNIGQRYDPWRDFGATFTQYGLKYLGDLEGGNKGF